jgi:hypothetical protein
MHSIDLSDSDYDTFMKWIGQRCSVPRPSSRKAQELERRAYLVLKKINKRYGTK